MNPLIIEVMIEEKRRDMLKEAERQRVAAIYNANNPGRWVRLQLALGDFLIRVGQKIKRRSAGSLDLTDDLCRE